MSPGSTGSFLTALAAQERRVLELREDLQRAEADLARLKSQWTIHEMTRKRSEIRHVEQLQTFGVVQSDMDGCAEEESGPPRFSSEMDRRRAMGGDTSPTKRKVFSGSRHMRTLSLLSSNATKIHSQPLSAGGDPSQSKYERDPADPLSRSSTVPILPPRPKDIMVEKGSSRIPAIHDPPRDALLRTGRQIAVDFKEGLWTFIEDLRQATVGDEGISSTQSRTMSALPAKAAPKQSSKMCPRSKEAQTPVRQSTQADDTESPSGNAVDKSALIDVGGISKTTPAMENATARAIVLTPGHLQQPAQGESVCDHESWEDWDSPSSKVQLSGWTGDAWLSDIEFSSPLRKGMRSTWYVWTRIRSIPLVAIILRLFFSPRQCLSSG